MNAKKIERLFSNKYAVIGTIAITWVSTLLLALSALTTMFGYGYYTTKSPFETTGGTNPFFYGYVYAAHPYNLYFTLLTAISIVLLSMSLFLYHRR